jgi:hypothetical protein
MTQPSEVQDDNIYTLGTTPLKLKGESETHKLKKIIFLLFPLCHFKRYKIFCDYIYKNILANVTIEPFSYLLCKKRTKIRNFTQFHNLSELRFREENTYELILNTL